MNITVDVCCLICCIGSSTITVSISSTLENINNTLILCTSLLDYTGETLINSRRCLVNYLHVLRPFPHVFLCCDWLWLATGSESGRSSPYYGQEERSTTPTTNQPPKHFHVPGRTFISPSHIANSNVDHSENVCHVNNYVCTCDLVAFLYNAQTLRYILPHVASLPCFDFFCNPPFLIPPSLHHPSSHSHPLLHLFSMFHVLISCFFPPQPQGTTTSTGSRPSIRERVQCS